MREASDCLTTGLLTASFGLLGLGLMKRRKGKVTFPVAIGGCDGDQKLGKGGD